MSKFARMGLCLLALFLGFLLGSTNMANLNNGTQNVAFVTQSVDDTENQAIDEAEPKFTCAIKTALSEGSELHITIVTMTDGVESQILPAYSYYHQAWVNSLSDNYTATITSQGEGSLIIKKPGAYSVNGAVKDANGVLINCTSADIIVS